MRILLVTITSPWPPTNGQRIRNCSIIRALCEDGHEVSLISFQEQSGESPKSPKTWCGDIVWVPRPRGYSGNNYLGRLWALLAGLPFGVVRFRSREMTAAVTRRLSAGNIDALICDDVYVIANVADCHGIPLLLNKASIVFEEAARYAAHSQNVAVRAYVFVESRLLRRWEVRSCNRANLLLTCSDRDRRVLQRLEVNTNSFVVPNALDLRDYEAYSGDDGRTVMFTGAMDWYPNQDAVSFFVAAIWPALQRLVPHTEFLVVGRNPPSSLRRSLATQGRIRFTGTVPDIRPVLKQAAVCVVPLRIGSGTRIKILEAAAMGKAIVSTSVGAEGLEFENGREIIIADRPQEFAEAVAHLLENRKLRDQMGQAARRRVCNSHGIEAVRAGLRSAFEAIAPTNVSAVKQSQTRSQNNRVPKIQPNR